LSDFIFHVNVAATFRACPERIEGLRKLYEIVINLSDGNRPNVPFGTGRVKFAQLNIIKV